MVQLVAKALMLSKQRAIVLGGWAGLSMDRLRAATTDETLIKYADENVLFVEKAPHEWLFPQVKCTIHHGGAGTLAAAVRAGVPTIITPVFLDQWDHAYLVNELGIGTGMKKQFQSITPEELSRAITSVVESEVIAAKAEEVGAKLMAENGVKAAVCKVKEYWNDQVCSG